MAGPATDLVGHGRGATQLTKEEEGINEGH